MTDGSLLYMENEHYSLVDALPYIDTHLGQTEVAQQVKYLIDEEMKHFEPRDYLASLPAPELPFLQTDLVQQEFARIEAGQPLAGIDMTRYQAAALRPTGPATQDPLSWKKAAEHVRVTLEFNRLRMLNLELMDKWGNKAWVAHSLLVRSTERVLTNEATELRNGREEVNKKRKLDQISCGNELRKLTYELEQYQRDNAEAEKAVRELEAQVSFMREQCLERGVRIHDLISEPTPKAAPQAYSGISLPEYEEEKKQ